MVKSTLLATLVALTLSPVVNAKVTYADAVKDQTAYNTKLRALAPPPTIGYTDVDLDGIKPNDWLSLYTGDSVGPITIPSNAKMVMVQTSAGSATFPTNSGHLTLATATDHSKACNLTATAHAIFTGSQVKGGEDRKSFNCGGFKDSEKKIGHAYAKVTIQKILYQQ